MSTLETHFKVFRHLVDTNDQLIAQRDSEPGGCLNLTSRSPAGPSSTIMASSFLPIYHRQIIVSSSTFTIGPHLSKLGQRLPIRDTSCFHIEMSRRVFYNV
jgi:hypothetical protein